MSELEQVGAMNPEIMHSEPVVSQASGCGCAKCANAAQKKPVPVWAIGQIRHEWANESARKEYEQVRRMVQARHASDQLEAPSHVKLTDRDLLYLTLSDTDFRYLAHVSCSCWAFAIEGVLTYVLVPADPTELDTLIKSTRSSPAVDLSAVIGQQTGTVSPEMCHGIELPMVIVHKVYNFSRHSLVDELAAQLVQRDQKQPRPIPENEREAFVKCSAELFERLIRSSGDGAGKNRILAWALVRSWGLYVKAFEMLRREFSLTLALVERSPLSGTRPIYRITLRFTQLFTGFTESYRQDVSAEGLYPYLVNGLTLCVDP